MKIKLILIICSVVLIGGCGKKYHLNQSDIDEHQPWPSHRYNYENTGAITAKEFSGKLEILWEKNTHDRPTGPLTMINDRLLYPCTLKRIKVFNSKTGKYNGFIKTSGIPYTGISIVDSLGYVTVAPRKNKLKCINLLYNKTLWEKKVKDAVGGSIIINNRLIVGTADGNLLSVDRMDGELIWTFRSNSRFHQPPAVNNGIIYQAGDNGIVYGISSDDGKELFRTELENPVAASITVGKLIFVADITGQVYGLDPKKGTVIWQTKIGGPVWSPGALSKDILLYGHSAGSVVALNSSDGTVLWQKEFNEVIRASILVINDIVIVGTMRGNLFSLRLDDGSIIEQLAIEEPIARSPVSDGERVYVATERGKITCFGEKHENNKQINEGKLSKY